METTTSQHDKLSFLITTALYENNLIKPGVRYIAVKICTMMSLMCGMNVIEMMQHLNFIEQGKFSEARVIVANVIFKQSDYSL